MNPVIAPVHKSMIVRDDDYERGTHNAPEIPTILDDVKAFPDEAR